MSVADLLDFSPEITHARAERKPIVALESTIITHGMPYPQNFNTALMLDEAVRAQGATPATIGPLAASALAASADRSNNAFAAMPLAFVSCRARAPSEPRPDYQHSRAAIKLRLRTLGDSAANRPAPHPASPRFAGRGEERRRIFPSPR